MNHSRATPPDHASLVRTRRERLIERISALKLDCAVLTDPREITYFTSSPPGAPAQVPACLLVRANGDSVLICGESPTKHLVDEVLIYPWHTGGTVSTALMPRLTQLAVQHLRLASARVGIQHESISAQLLCGLAVGAFEPIDAVILDLERTKDPLDLFRLEQAILANLAALDSARSVIAPGVSELEVFASASRAATLRAGAKVVHDGDYRSAVPGGSCRDRRITSGELYIIDAWTNVAGYWSDLARTFPVGAATDENLRLIDHVTRVHEKVRPELRPGASGNDIWKAMDAALRELPSIPQLVHHGGHGIGLRLHESPDINPGITDCLRNGDVICIEPGAYLPSANVRVEETYLITANGAQCLSANHLATKGAGASR